MAALSLSILFSCEQKKDKEEQTASKDQSQNV